MKSSVSLNRLPILSMPLTKAYSVLGAHHQLSKLPGTSDGILKSRAGKQLLEGAGAGAGALCVG